MGINIVDTWEDLIRAWCVLQTTADGTEIWRDAVWTDWICTEAVKLEACHISRAVEMRVADILRRLGYVHRHRTILPKSAGHGSKKAWRFYRQWPPPVPLLLDAAEIQID